MPPAEVYLCECCGDALEIDDGEMQRVTAARLARYPGLPTADFALVCTGCQERIETWARAAGLTFAPVTH